MLELHDSFVGSWSVERVGHPEPSSVELTMIVKEGSTVWKDWLERFIRELLENWPASRFVGIRQIDVER